MGAEDHAEAAEARFRGRAPATALPRARSGERARGTSGASRDAPLESIADAKGGAPVQTPPESLLVGHPARQTHERSN